MQIIIDVSKPKKQASSNLNEHHGSFTKPVVYGGRDKVEFFKFDKHFMFLGRNWTLI